MLSMTDNRLTWVLGALLALQLILALALGLGGTPPDAEGPDAPLLAVSLEGVDRIDIEAPGARPEGLRVTLQKSDSGWRLPGYFDAPVAATRLTQWLERLGYAERGLPVATTAGARERFKVADEAFERRVSLRRGAETLAVLYLGESPGLHQVYARTDRDQAVYAVRLSTYEAPAEPGGWLDPTLLAVEAGGIEEIELADGLRLRRDGEGWAADGLAEGEVLDPAAAEVLARRLEGLNTERLLGTEPPAGLTDLAPILTLSARGAEGVFGWTLWRRGEVEGEDERKTYVLRRSDRPWYAELTGWNAEALIEAAGRSALLPRPEPGSAAEADAADSTNEAAE